MNPSREHVAEIIHLPGGDCAWRCLRCNHVGHASGSLTRTARNARQHELRANRRLADYLAENTRRAN